MYRKFPSSDWTCKIWKKYCLKNNKILKINYKASLCLIISEASMQYLP